MLHDSAAVCSEEETRAWVHRLSAETRLESIKSAFIKFIVYFFLRVFVIVFAAIVQRLQRFVRFHLVVDESQLCLSEFTHALC